MSASLQSAVASRHPELSDIRPRMAKADVRKAEVDFRAQVGRAIQRAASLRGWTLKELAAAVNHDARQVARWINGQERPHFDALFAVEELRQPLVVAIAELAGEGVEIDTVIRVRCVR